MRRSVKHRRDDERSSVVEACVVTDATSHRSILARRPTTSRRRNWHVARSDEGEEARRTARRALGHAHDIHREDAPRHRRRPRRARHTRPAATVRLLRVLRPERAEPLEHPHRLQEPATIAVTNADRITIYTPSPADAAGAPLYAPRSAAASARTASSVVAAVPSRACRQLPGVTSRPGCSGKAFFGAQDFDQRTRAKRSAAHAPTVRR